MINFSTNYYSAVLRYKTLGLLLTLLFTLGGCVTKPPASLNNQAVLVPAKDAYINPPQPSQFDLVGKLAAHSKGRNITVMIHWQTENPCTFIQVKGFLGIGSGELKSCPGEAILYNSFTGEKKGSSIEQLMFENTGYNVPLSNINYWLNGVPATNRAKITLDPQQRTASIEENMWRAVMSYPDIKAVRPNRIEVTPLSEAIIGNTSNKPVPADTKVIFFISQRTESLN